MRKRVLVVSGLAVAGLVVSVFLFWRFSRHPNYYVTQAIISPLPPTLHHVKTIYLFKPSLGDGLCVAAYSISPGEFTRLLQAHAWKNDLKSASFEAERHFREVWPNSTPEFEAYHFTINDWRYVDMAVSLDHTKIIFYMSI